jgi:hypothetical protein
MKFLLLFVLLVIPATVFAAPKPKVAPKVTWEYAFVKSNSNRLTKSGVNYETGILLRLHPRAPVFLPYPQGRDREEFLLDVFSRLGNQGWELVTSPGYQGTQQYIFKRHK